MYYNQQSPTSPNQNQVIILFILFMNFISVTFKKYRVFINEFNNNNINIII